MRKPLHPCAASGCGALIMHGSYCEDHKAKRTTTSQRSGYNAKWYRYSRTFLARHPFCVDPFGRHRDVLVEATVTGHKIAHKGNEQLMWNPDNHFPLCASCNSFQCAKYEGGFGNPTRDVPAQEVGRS